ncbi:helix-turn-helix domain-containing protein [Rhodococcus zopfii]
MPGLSDGARRRPPPPLRRYVRWYDGYRLTDFPAGEHLGLPSQDLTIVLTIGAPLELARAAAPGQRPGTFGALASGLTTAPVTIAHDGNQHGIQLAMTPAGARVLLGIPAGALGAWVVELEDVLGAGARELQDRVAATDEWPERFAVLDDVLGRLARRAGHPGGIDTRLARAWQQLTSTDGPGVRAVADDIGWSRRHLTGRFTAEYGIGPKDAARLARFDRSRELLRTPGRRRLADVAARAGYYDQAHLARDWRDLAGVPPSQWMDDEVFPIVQEVFPIVQDEGGPAGAG